MGSPVTDTVIESYRAAVEAARADDVAALLAHYAEHVRFEDPISRVNGRAGVERAFTDTWRFLPRARFRVRSHAIAGDLAYVRWALVEDAAGGEKSLIEAVGELRFDADGRIDRHVDYWDSVSAIYRRIPVLRQVLELFRRRVSAGWERPRSAAT